MQTTREAGLHQNPYPFGLVIGKQSRMMTVWTEVLQQISHQAFVEKLSVSSNGRNHASLILLGECHKPWVRPIDRGWLFAELTWSAA